MINCAATLLLTIGVLIGCSSRENDRIQTRKMGEYYVKANILLDSILNGNANFYDNQGNLYAKIMYKYGVKNGPAVYYNKNGIKTDSMNFEDGVQNGFEFTYDSHGQLSGISYQYYNLKMGPELLLFKDKAQEYFFTDFNKEDLIDCKYDSVGNVDQLKFFTMRPSISNGLIENERMLSLFMYLPNPPNLNIIYSVGITNHKKQNKFLFSLNENRVFLDTLLPYPSKNWHYYVSAQMKNKNGSINKVFIEEIQHKE